jgi:hypothetical protein
MVPEGVDPAAVECQDVFGACGDAQLAALAAILGDDERSPRRMRPGSHGNLIYRHSLFAFGCEPVAEQATDLHRDDHEAAGDSGLWRSRARD